MLEMAKGFQGKRHLLVMPPWFFFPPPLLWRIPPSILSPSTLQPCLTRSWRGLKVTGGKYQVLPFPLISSSPALSHDKFSSGRAPATEAPGAQGEGEEKQELEIVTLSPASVLAELCQGNLIPMCADKMVPSGTAQITAWKLAALPAMEKVTVGQMCQKPAEQG